MKKLVYLVILMVISTQFIACGVSKDIDMEEVVKVSNDIADSPLQLSTEQKIEDFQYLYETMNKLYPYWGEIKDLGKDPEGLYNKYLEEVQKTESDMAFCNTVLAYFDELDAYTIGHLSVMNPGSYEYLKVLYGDIENRRSWFKVLSNPISTKLYSACDIDEVAQFKRHKEDELENEEQKEAIKEIALDSNPIRLEVIEDGEVGYIKVPSFDALNIEEQVPKIRAFIQEHQDLEHMIIDIRGNGGGGDSYWREAFVSPNITEEQYYTNYYLYNLETIEDELTKPFIEEINAYLYEEKRKIEELPDSISLNSNGCQFEYFTCETQEIKPHSQEVDYSGKFWLLIDKYNASASSSFIQFCKENQFATLVGEPDNGDNCNGDPFLFSLPNSGVIIRFDLFYGVNIDGTCNGISGCQPDIECASVEALQVCLENIRMS